jgi:vacuolar protein sorting-associated protein 54
MAEAITNTLWYYMGYSTPPSNRNNSNNHANHNNRRSFGDFSSYGSDFNFDEQFADPNKNNDENINNMNSSDQYGNNSNVNSLGNSPFPLLPHTQYLFDDKFPFQKRPKFFQKQAADRSDRGVSSYYTFHLNSILNNPLLPISLTQANSSYIESGLNLLWNGPSDEEELENAVLDIPVIYNLADAAIGIHNVRKYMQKISPATSIFLLNHANSKQDYIDPPYFSEQATGSNKIHSQHAQEQLTECYNTVPSKYFDENYDLLRELIDETGRNSKYYTADASNPQDVNNLLTGTLQIDLNNYFDCVEQCLFTQLTHRSHLFFRSLKQIQSIHAEIATSVELIQRIREEMALLKARLTDSGLKIMQKQRNLNNSNNVTQKLELITTVINSQATVKLLISTADFSSALELISSTISVVNSELVDIRATQFIPTKLLEMNRLINKLIQEEFLNLSLPPFNSNSNNNNNSSSNVNSNVSVVDAESLDRLLILLEIMFMNFPALEKSNWLEVVESYKKLLITRIKADLMQTVQRLLKITDKTNAEAGLSTEGATVSDLDDENIESPVAVTTSTASFTVTTNNTNPSSTTHPASPTVNFPGANAVLSRSPSIEAELRVKNSPLHRSSSPSQRPTTDPAALSTLKLPPTAPPVAKPATLGVSAAQPSTETNSTISYRLQLLNPSEFNDFLAKLFDELVSLVQRGNQVSQLFKQLSAPPAAAEGFNDVLAYSIEFIHAKLAKIINARSNLHSKYTISELKSLFLALLSICEASDSLAQKQLFGLRGLLLVQSRLNLNAFHKREMQKIATALQNEPWTRLNSIPIAYQQLIDNKFAQKLNVGQNLTSTIDRKYIFVANSAPSAANEGDSSSSSASSYSKFCVTASLLELLVSLSNYIEYLNEFPSVSTEIISRLIELIQLFNSRVCQLILGAGAMHFIGLKSITATHLSLAHQTIGLIASQIPQLKQLFQQALPQSKQSFLSAFDRIGFDCLSHQKEIRLKLIAIMRELIVSMIHKLSQDKVIVNPPSSSENIAELDLVSPNIRVLMKQTSSLHRALTDLLAPDDRNNIFIEIVNLFISAMSEQFELLIANNPNNPILKYYTSANLHHVAARLRALNGVHTDKFSKQLGKYLINSTIGLNNNNAAENVEAGDDLVA